ncbi:MAG: glycosyltransferase family 4 protein [Gammaproteobacteria bacterium]|nr:glycosyltransferase family 4 protein [Gammaproteobacteria bacterium]
MTPDLTFAIPGDLQTLTGGYGYDRRLIAGLQALGLSVAHMLLSGTFPVPDAAALADAESRFATLPDGAIVIADGLAFGVMEEIAERHGARLQIIALCHHPLALEAGLSAEQAQCLKLSEQRALQAARAVLVTSSPTANLLTRQFSISESKITVALPGTDRQHFAACAGNPPVLLTVATLTPRKAHDVLIEALAQISDLPWSARFVGGMEFDPAWAAALRAKVQAWGLQQRIHFLGGLAALEHEYDDADLFVLPSLFEGYGMAFAEALAHGLPIVAARAGAVPDVVPESAGILVPPGDAMALAEALRELLSDPARRAALQRGAQEAAGKLPTWTDTARTVAALINRIRSNQQAQE